MSTKLYTLYSVASWTQVCLEGFLAPSSRSKLLMPPSFPEGQGSEAVEERLVDLENAGYFRGGSLDDRVLEMLAKLSPEEGLKALQEFETRVVAGRACCPSSGLADLIRALLEANAHCSNASRKEVRVCSSSFEN